MRLSHLSSQFCRFLAGLAMLAGTAQADPPNAFTVASSSFTSPGLLAQVGREQSGIVNEAWLQTFTNAGAQAQLWSITVYGYEVSTGHPRLPLYVQMFDWTGSALGTYRGGVQVPADGSVFGFGTPGTATIDFSSSGIYLAASSAYAIVFSSVAYGSGDEVNGNYGLYSQGGFSETYAGGNSYRYLEYNPVTQTPTGSLSSSFGDLAFTVTAVPEPSTWALASGLAALALGWWRRRVRGV